MKLFKEIKARRTLKRWNMQRSLTLKYGSAAFSIAQMAYSQNMAWPKKALFTREFEACVSADAYALKDVKDINSIENICQTVHHNAVVHTVQACIKEWNISTSCMGENPWPEMPEIDYVKRGTV